ncbi:MAG: hypothetical protein LBB36_05210 [Fibromonadaceae bacterium]|jgi:hypothetical protein|nr:hypothetical protein [Fibromonadaceae bacterium]
MPKYVAETDKSTNIEDKIKYSYSYGGYDFYYIYLGELKNIPLFYHTAEHHNGINSTYTIEVSETIKNSTTETIKNNIETIINVVDTYTTSTAMGGKISTEIKSNPKFLWGLITIEGPKAAGELYWDDYVYNSTKTDFKQTTSLASTITTGTEYTKSTMKSRSWNFTRDDKIGYYRYTLFSASDVYLYVIKDPTGMIHCEYREYVISDSLNNNAWVLDYSEDGNFRKSDETGFEFDVSMLDNLPETKLVLTDPPIILEEHTERKEFTTAGNHTYTFDKGFPATVEVYSLGSGGGGQGGHRYERFMSSHGSGVGGSGGGGATTYMKFSVEKSVTFDITVGKGGTGGKGYKDPMINFSKSGDPGNNGENTLVKFGSTTLIAEGGSGGGGSGQALNYGSGGRLSLKLGGDLLGWESNNGGNGINGTENSSGTGMGGSAAKITEGSETFGGGSGAINSGVMAQAGGGGYGGYDYTQSGSNGGDGHVIIIIKYFKEL